MALDAEGYIAVPPVTAFQPAFQAIVDDTIHQLRLTVGDDLHSLWLYGSVAFGTAVEGQSDLDVCLVFRARYARQPGGRKREAYGKASCRQ